jgi:hypothetical protein
VLHVISYLSILCSSCDFYSSSRKRKRSETLSSDIASSSYSHVTGQHEAEWEKHKSQYPALDYERSHDLVRCHVCVGWTCDRWNSQHAHLYQRLREHLESKQHQQQIRALTSNQPRIDSSSTSVLHLNTIGLLNKFRAIYNLAKQNQALSQFGPLRHLLSLMQTPGIASLSDHYKSDSFVRGALRSMNALLLNDV